MHDSGDPQNLERESERLLHALPIQGRKWKCTVTFPEFAAAAAEDERDVRVNGLWITKRPLQNDLTRGRWQKVGAAHDLGNTLIAIIHDDSQLVGKESVRSADHEVAGSNRNVFFNPPEDPVIEGHPRLVDLEANRPRRPVPGDSRAARARIHQLTTSRRRSRPLQI
jgi:hypothetical protein